MKTLTCKATRRRLAEFHDGELSVEDQLAVAAHLDWCEACAAAREEMAILGAALRAVAPGRSAASSTAQSALPAVVVGRLKAERTVSLASSVQAMFEDLHFVYAGGAAAVAALVFAVVMLGTMKLVSTIRPDSLAALVDLLTPGSNQNPVVARANLQMPKPLEQEFAPLMALDAGSEGVYALAATVTREGRVTNLALLDTEGDEEAHTHDADHKAIAGLVDAMSRARFEPGNVDGTPVAVNMVWLIARTTVRGQSQPPTLAPSKSGRNTPITRTSQRTRNLV